MTTLYVGKRQGDDSATAFKKVDGAIKVLQPRFDLANHSPTGFEWGYQGSGPSQLALAILADALRDDMRALSLYMDFKTKVIAQQPKQGFCLCKTEVEAAVAEIDKSRDDQASKPTGENHGR